VSCGVIIHTIGEKAKTRSRNVTVGPSQTLVIGRMRRVTIESGETCIFQRYCRFHARTLYRVSLDLTKDGRAVHMVDEIAAVALDIWAEEHDYSKLETNLLEM
jgi:hypothetical protein